jgi:hypothetical protein
MNQQPTSVSILVGMIFGFCIGLFVGLDSGREQQCQELGGVITYQGDCYIE